MAPCGAGLSCRPLLASDFAARRTTAHVAQSVEHLHGKQKVSGSIPLVGSITRIANGRVSKTAPGTSPLVLMTAEIVFMWRVCLNGEAEV